MTQIAILNGIYADESPDYRTAYPRNLIPVPKDQGISKGYLRPADGIELFGTGPGPDRGAILWQDLMYRVMGTKLVRVGTDGSATELGDVGAGGQVTMDYSFDRLAIASNNSLYYWNGSQLTRVLDPDIGAVKDVLWVDGYFMTTDGTSLVVTELNDPNAVNPLKYGSSEIDPDPILSLLKLRNEVYVLNRHSIEVFDNIGGDNFPFQRIEGAQIPRGVMGTHACTLFAETIAFIGSGRNEAPSVYLANSGTTTKLATAEIDRILSRYSDAILSSVVVEARVDKAHNLLMIHLPDKTLVYDASATLAAGEPVWFILTSSVLGDGQYLARNLCWAYEKWISGDPTSGRMGFYTQAKSTHYGQVIGWDFSTTVMYNASRGAIVHEMELVALPGRVPLGADPVIWTSYSTDGVTWSQERAVDVGRQGERNKRIAWRRLGSFRNYRIQKFRGTSDAHLAIARLEAQIEPLGA